MADKLAGVMESCCAGVGSHPNTSGYDKRDHRGFTRIPRSMTLAELIWTGASPAVQVVELDHKSIGDDDNVLKHSRACDDAWKRATDTDTMCG